VADRAAGNRGGHAAAVTLVHPQPRRHVRAAAGRRDGRGMGLLRARTGLRPPPCPAHWGRCRRADRPGGPRVRVRLDGHRHGQAGRVVLAAAGLLAGDRGDDPRPPWFGVGRGTSAAITRNTWSRPRRNSSGPAQLRARVVGDGRRPRGSRRVDRAGAGLPGTVGSGRWTADREASSLSPCRMPTAHSPRFRGSSTWGHARAAVGVHDTDDRAATRPDR
jgi:hypothetical protein